MGKLTPVDLLRKAAWKGTFRGLSGAVEEIGDQFDELHEAWGEVQSAVDFWSDEDLRGEEKAEARETLEQALNAFDEAVKVLLGPSVWEMEITGGEEW